MAKTKGEKTQERIIGAAKILFGDNTYDYVTTRMIASKAKCSQSAISFYFVTKEKLCAAVIEDILKYHRIFYQPIREAVNECKKNNQLTKEQAFAFLMQYIHTQINITFDPRNRCALSFSVNGNTLPEGLTSPLNKSISLNVEKPIAELLRVYSDNILTDEKAKIYAQSLINIIITYPFTSSNTIFNNSEALLEDPEKFQISTQNIQQTLIEICTRIIKSLQALT